MGQEEEEESGSVTNNVNEVHINIRQCHPRCGVIYYLFKNLRTFINFMKE